MKTLAPYLFIFALLTGCPWPKDPVEPVQPSDPETALRVLRSDSGDMLVTTPTERLVIIHGATDPQVRAARLDELMARTGCKTLPCDRPLTISEVEAMNTRYRGRKEYLLGYDQEQVWVINDTEVFMTRVSVATSINGLYERVKEILSCAPCKPNETCVPPGCPPDRALLDLGEYAGLPVVVVMPPPCSPTHAC